MCEFRVGMRVVCVNDDWAEVELFGVIFPPRVPMLNEVLTISSMTSSLANAVYFGFYEIPLRQEHQDVKAVTRFLSDHFRPLVERKTSIAIFQAMLITPKVGIPA